MLAQGGSVVTALVLILVLGAVIFSLKMSGTRIVHLKVCRNRSIFLSFILLIVIYFMCYTSLWMQVQEFRGSFEKRIKSYSDHRYNWIVSSPKVVPLVHSFVWFSFSVIFGSLVIFFLPPVWYQLSECCERKCFLCLCMKRWICLYREGNKMVTALLSFWCIYYSFFFVSLILLEVWKSYGKNINFLHEEKNIVVNVLYTCSWIYLLLKEVWFLLEKILHRFHTCTKRLLVVVKDENVILILTQSQLIVQCFIGLSCVHVYSCFMIMFEIKDPISIILSFKENLFLRFWLLDSFVTP